MKGKYSTPYLASISIQIFGTAFDTASAHQGPFLIAPSTPSAAYLLPRPELHSVTVVSVYEKLVVFSTCQDPVETQDI